MTNQIVTVQVSVQQAPTPNLLQRRGAAVSQGGTTLTAQTYSFLTKPADLTPLLPAALALTSITWSSGLGGTATATATANHGIAVGQQFVTTIAGALPAGYAGTFLATSTGAATFTYRLPTNPGATPATTAGTYTRRGVGELQAMVNTFFGQGSQQGLYVLELGAGEPSAGVTALDSFIDNNDQFFYSYLLPRSWDGVSSFLSFLAGFESETSKTYFFVTTNEQNYSLYSGIKCAEAFIENPVYGVWAQGSVSNATWSGGTATVTTGAAHGVIPGDAFTLNGILPAGYNGTFIALPTTTGSTLVYSLASDPGAYSSGGTLVASPYAATGVSATEFSHAADFWRTLSYDPSSTNKVYPLAFTRMSGVTTFQTKANAPLLSSIKAAYVNYGGYGGEGGIDSTINYWGVTADGRPWNYWYAIDYAQIQSQLFIANAIINGSNPVNPLFISQAGVDRLQEAVVGVAQRMVTFGMAVGQVVQTGLTAAELEVQLDRGTYAGNVLVNAVPFSSYYSLSPSDYAIGKYAGLSMVFAPLRGFQEILFNIVATDLVAAPA